MVLREKSNPIIVPADIRPISEDFEVIGVFNPGVALFGDKVVLLLRVAERPKVSGDGILRVPFLDESGRIGIKAFDLADEAIDYSDKRVVRDKDGTKYLTSFSSFLVAFSDDGVHFSYGKRILPETCYESFGIEDPRITNIGGDYWITYTCVSDRGIATGLMVTRDFVHFCRKGIIMTPDNKDVNLFGECIGGYYYALNRPSTSEYGKPEIWISKSPDLLCWGDHKLLMRTRKGMWDSARIGANFAPIRTEHGWLLIYHGVDENNFYRLGAALLDLYEPDKVIARTDEPFMSPEAEYEREGFFSNVIFPCGCIDYGDAIDIYYGAADYCIGKATVCKKKLFHALQIWENLPGEGKEVKYKRAVI